MSLYFGTTEITNIDNLVPQTGLDITDIWFGSTNVYTVWETYEGTLPATINANGDNMKQYQVWGNTGGVGDDSGTAYGYEVDMGVKSANLFNKSSVTMGYSISYDGHMLENQNFGISNYINVNVGKYCVSNLTRKSVDWTLRVHGYDESNVWIREVCSCTVLSYVPNFFTFNISSEIKKIRLSIGIVDRQNLDILMLTKGTIPPDEYQPYYNTTTPIYIGDEPLKKDEYVDYKAGKVYRRTAQVMPSAKAETKTLNGITVTCDGEGRYSISGTATDATSIRFDIPEFIIPVSVGQGGQGTMSLFNTTITSSYTTTIGFYYNSEEIDTWSLNTPNRTNDSYAKIGNKRCNAMVISISTLGDANGTLSPMFTNNGAFPETYIPYLQPTDPPVALPALPTCDGTTIVDYAGQSVAVPEKVVFEYRKEGF